MDDIVTEFKDEIYKDETIEEDDINYYKNLLNLQGFSFDENKQCILVYQEYIH